MKILVGCLNVNGLGGSELYHYELVRELASKGHEVTLFTLRSIDRTDQVRIKLDYLQINQVDCSILDVKKFYDIVVVSQPEVTKYLLDRISNTPTLSIIHSEIRSEDPVLDSRINHYIGIRQSIVDMLINDYKIDSEKVSLIYNPIDTSRFNPVKKPHRDKIRGIFVGEVLDPIRFQAVSHLVQSCIENDWELFIMSDSKYDYNHPNIKYIDKRWDTETVVRDLDFTAGILLGRTTLEGICCDVPAYMYGINQHGDILSINTEVPENIKNLCDSKYVVEQHIELYNKIQSNTK